MALYDIEARKLDKFIFDHLQPNEVFLNSVKWSVDKICSFLKENCFKDYFPPPRPRVLKVVKGGSSGKGTALKKSSDADLVVFVTNFKDYSDQKNYRKEIIQEIENKLSKCIGTSGPMEDIRVSIQQTTWENPRVLSFSFNSRYSGDSIEFDVLPAYDALGQHRKGEKPDPEVYIELIKSIERGGEFSTCFTELQKEFVIDRPTKLKNLIRLVKYWYKECVLRKKKPGVSLPPKYALELLAIYAWEKGSQETDFDMAKGFRTVLWLIQQHEKLCIFWTKYYDFQNETLGQYLRGQLKKSRPVILDPADPTGNVGEGSRWDVVAQEALHCSQQICCTTFSGVPVGPWDVLTSCDVDISYSPPRRVTVQQNPNIRYMGGAPLCVQSSTHLRQECQTSTRHTSIQEPRQEEGSYCNIL